MNILLIVLLIVYPFIFKLIERYFAQKGANMAQKEDMRDIQYEAKKGEILATKEDLNDINIQIETIRNTISFASQRKHDNIQDSTKRLLNILHLTEKLNEYQAILLYYLYDKHSEKRLMLLIEQINETMLSFLHESRIVYVTIIDADLTKRISELVQVTQKYAQYLCYIASNASGHLTNWHEYLQLGKETKNSEVLQQAIQSQANVDKIRKEFENEIKSEQEPLYDCQIKYMAKLSSLFGEKINFKDSVINTSFYNINHD